MGSGEGRAPRRGRARGNPGSFDGLHRSCKEVFPPQMEGVKLIVTKTLSSHFQVTHTVHMSTLGPSGYRFNATFLGDRQLGPTEVFPTLLGDMDSAGSLNAQVLQLLGERLRTKAVFQAQRSRFVTWQFDAEYRGDDCTAALTLGNPDLLAGSGILVAHFLQSVTARLVLGAELVYHRRPGEEGAILTLAGKYSGGDTGDTGDSWGQLGTMGTAGDSSGTAGGAWGQLGTPWEHLGMPQGQLGMPGDTLGTSGDSWGYPGTPWEHLGTPWGHLGMLGDTLGTSGDSCGDLGDSWGTAGYARRHLGTPWGYLGDISGTVWGQLGMAGNTWGCWGTSGDIWGHLGDTWGRWLSVAAPNWEATLNVGYGGAHASYYHRANEQVQVGVELEANPRLQESSFAFGYQLNLPRANAVFRGLLDSSWSVGGVLEKRLPPLPVTLALGAFLNHRRDRFHCGFGVTVA
uniref:Translocase of outer mitochondrial membrane 40 like n=1 Tax=Taeniopygia guttata TaxID=59729 RepID=A0A674GJH6_TAEGU